MFKWDFLYFCLCPLPLFLPLRITMKIHPSRVFTHKDLSETSHFWAEQSQLSQPLLLCQMLQTLYHFCGLLLDPLQCAHLHWGAQIWTQQSSHISSGQTRGKGSPHRMCWHCSSQCIPTVGFLCCRSTLPTDANLVPSKTPGAFFARLFYNSLAPAWPGAWAGPNISLSWTSGGSCHSFLQPVYVPVHGSTTISCISHFSHFLSFATLLKACSVSSSRWLMKIRNTSCRTDFWAAT